MDAAEITEVCRLCPSSGGGEDLLYVFDDRLSVKNNMKEVILVTTGIEIQESDIVSKKICNRCCNKTLQMFLFRQDAHTQDRALKEKCSRLLEDKGIRLPNTCITIKRERRDSYQPLKRPKEEPDDVPSIPVKTHPAKMLHPSVAKLYKRYPNIKIPKKCLDKHLAPVLSFTMGEVEKYFRSRKLDMKKYIYKPRTKTISPKAVAKKRTSFPTKQRTVTPIKISKKILENHEVQTLNSNDYVCTLVHKEKKKRKKSFSSPDCNKIFKSDMPQKDASVQPQILEKTNKSPESLPEKQAETQTAVANPPILVTPTVMVKPATPVLSVSEPIRPKSPTPIASISSEEMCAGSTSKPEFIESLGLTPTVTATKAQTIHICNLCGSVHNNAFKLKTHSRKHMVCQFCKLRFKTIESKQDHVDHFCQVKEILNSTGPVVELEKVHLNLTVRNKYKDAFSSFDSIPGFMEVDPLEDVIVKAESPVAFLDTEEVVLISDDKETSTACNDLQSVVQTSVPETEKLAQPPTSIIKPQVRIKNNTVLNSMKSNVSDKQVIKDLLVLFKSQSTTTIEKILQTDLPANKDIKINIAEGFCEFKNLKEQLLFNKIPVVITDGPFHVAYQYKNNSSSTKTMAMWDDLPVIDVYKKNDVKESESTISTTNKVVGVRSQPSAVSSTPLKITISKSSLAKVQTSVPLLKGNTATNSKNNVDMGHILSYVNSFRSSSPLKRNATTSSKNSMSGKLPKKSLPAKIEKTARPATTNKRSSLPNSKAALSSLSLRRNSSTRLVATPDNSGIADSTSTSEALKVRVKNVWELQ